MREAQSSAFQKTLKINCRNLAKTDARTFREVTDYTSSGQRLRPDVLDRRSEIKLD